MNPKRLAQTLLGTVQVWVKPAFENVYDRLDDVDRRLAAIPTAKDGKDVDEDAIVARVVAQIPMPKDGKDVDQKALFELVAKLVDEAVDAMPKPKDGERGKDGEVHPDTMLRLAADAVRAYMKDVPPPKDGKDVDPAFVRELVQAAVTTAIAALPKPEPGAAGKDADADAIRQQLREELSDEVAQAVRDIPKPRDGKDGENGKNVDPAVIVAAVQSAVDPVARQFTDMADELLRAFEEDISLAPTAAPSLSVNIGADGKRDGAHSFTAREHVLMGREIANTIKETLMLPVKPVYDEKTGKLLYGQRVAPS